MTYELILKVRPGQVNVILEGQVFERKKLPFIEIQYLNYYKDIEIYKTESFASIFRLPGNQDEDVEDVFLFK